MFQGLQFIRAPLCVASVGLALLWGVSPREPTTLSARHPGSGRAQAPVSRGARAQVPGHGSRQGASGSQGRGSISFARWQPPPSLVYPHPWRLRAPEAWRSCRRRLLTGFLHFVHLSAPSWSLSEPGVLEPHQANSKGAKNEEATPRRTLSCIQNPGSTPCPNPLLS